MSVEKARDGIERAMNAHNPESMQAFAAVAQAEAMLALVEQQRIANLIEVARWNDNLLRGGDAPRKPGGVEVDLAAEREKVDGLFRMVGEGLGIS